MKKMLIVAAVLAPLAMTSRATLIPITNFDFETPVTASGANSTAVSGWIEENAAQEYVTNNAGAWAPAGATQTGYFTGAATGINQDLGHNWAVTDQFTLTVDAYDVGWLSGAGETGQAVGFQLREVGGGAVLWDSGSISLDGTVQGDAINNITWIGDGSQRTRVFNINASTFSGGAAGSQINLRIYQDTGPAYFDNVTLDVVVPEPTSIGLMAAFGGALLFVRRRQRI